MIKTIKVINSSVLATSFSILLIGLTSSISAQSLVPSDNGTGYASKKVYSVERDPFSPVGFTKEVETPLEEKVDEPEEKLVAGSSEWNEAMKMIKVGGISNRGDDFFAVINGKVKRTGETVTVDFRGRKYTWVIGKITPPRSVKLQRDSVQ